MTAALPEALLPAGSAASSSPRWTRLAPVAVGLLAAVVYGWNLTVSGYANTYYSAAAQAAGQSWSAMFYGAIDAAGFITVDKPPASLWLMGLSVRLLGLSPLAVLLPQALAGVASVVLLHATVRRSFGRVAALIAAVGLAITPSPR
jgi:4-amino-4-deoxy-L-arabinose transferase-like glycosyltransferase